MKRFLWLVRHHTLHGPLVLLREVLWKYLSFRLWPVMSGSLRAIAKTSKLQSPKNFSPTNCIMLVRDGAAADHYGGMGANQTKNFERWMTEVVGVKTLIYLDSLDQYEFTESKTVVIANYDWVINVVHNPLTGGLRKLSRVVAAARKSGTPIWCPLIDIFGIRYSFYTSIMAALSGGSNVLVQNTVAQAEKYGLVNPSGPHFWKLPPSTFDSWNQNSAWQTRERKILVPKSGDERRPDYYRAGLGRFSAADYKVVMSDHSLNWEGYMQLVKSCRVATTTCWLQPFYLQGPQRYRKLLADGHITDRVWEAFAAGVTLVTSPVHALQELGFLPGLHYVAAPERQESWEGWALPSDSNLAQIASRGHQRMYDLLSEEWGPALVAKTILV